MKEEYNYKGELFLDAIYKELHKNTNVTKYKDSKKEAIHKYLERLEEMHRRANTETKKDIVKEMYYRKYLPTEEQLGYQASSTLAEQKRTLAEWLDYLMIEEEVHPVWLKYLVFQSMLRMGSKNPNTGMYNKRSKQTTTPFPELNQEVLTKSMDIINKYVTKNEFDPELLAFYSKQDPHFKNYIESGNFSKIYAILENEYEDNYHKRQVTTEGNWKKYHQGNRAEALQLVKDLYHKSTGWCTSGESFAINQICGPYSDAPKGGDFYVYYSKDEEGQETVPRIAIRMIDNNRIGEIRGVCRKQHLESVMVPILEEKINSLEIVDKSKDLALQKINNLKELERILNKKEELTPKELAFIYTTGFGFGWSNDPRVEQIIQKRDIMADYEKITDYHDKALMISMQREHLKDKLIIQDKELADYLLEYNFTCLPFISPNIEGYQELIKKTIERNPFTLNYVIPKNVKNYYELVETAINKNYMTFDIIKVDSLFKEEYISFIYQTLDQNVSMINHINLNKIDKNTYKEIILKYSNIEPKTILSTAKYDSFTSTEYEEIVVPILKQNDYQGLEYLDGKKLAKEKYLDLFYEAIKLNPANLTKIDINTIDKKDYKDLCQKAINNDIPILSYINPQYTGDPLFYKKLLIETIKKGLEPFPVIVKIILKYSRIGLLNKEDYQDIKEAIITLNPILSKKPKEELEKLELKELMREVEEIKTR